MLAGLRKVWWSDEQAPWAAVAAELRTCTTEACTANILTVLVSHPSRSCPILLRPYFSDCTVETDNMASEDHCDVRRYLAGKSFAGMMNCIAFEPE